MRVSDVAHHERGDDRRVLVREADDRVHQRWPFQPLGAGRPDAVDEHDQAEPRAPAA